MDQNILFTTPSCPKCKLAKQLLDQAGVQYTVTEDVTYAVSYGVQSAPSLLLNGQLLTFPQIISYCKGGASVV